MRRILWLAALMAAATATAGDVSWDEHPVVDGMRWTGRATRFREFTMGSDREGRRALDAGTTGIVTLPAQLNGCWVKSIGPRAFEGLEGLAEVVLPEGLREIGEEAFAGCTGLRRVVIPDSTSLVGARAFAGCTALREVFIGTNVWKIGESAFEGCISLKRMEMPEGERMAEIGPRAFAGCTGLRKLALAGRTYWIGTGAFAGCAALEKLEITAGDHVSLMLAVQRKAFSGCRRLKRVAWERPVQFVQEVVHGDDGSRKAVYSRTEDTVDAFEGCTAIREVVLNSKWPGEHGLAVIFPDSRGKIRSVECIPFSTAIAPGMFHGCTSLQKVVLPVGMETVPGDAFGECPDLKEVVAPPALLKQEWIRHLPEGCRVVPLPEQARDQ